MAYPYIWNWRLRLPERKGTECRILVRGPAKTNSALIEFRDGFKVVTSRWALREKPMDAPSSPVSPVRRGGS